MSDPVKDSAARRKEASAPAIFGPGDEQGAESAVTLRNVVERVRRLMGADTATIATFSLSARTATWKAASGFRTREFPDGHEVVTPLRIDLDARAGAATTTPFILKGIGAAGGPPGGEFPLHSAEGVRDLALMPLGGYAETFDALIVGYRAEHHFTDAEK